jgi:hypothetical protein
MIPNKNSAKVVVMFLTQELPSTCTLDQNTIYNIEIFV